MAKQFPPLPNPKLTPRSTYFPQDEGLPGLIVQRTSSSSYDSTKERSSHERSCIPLKNSQKEIEWLKINYDEVTKTYVRRNKDVQMRKPINDSDNLFSSEPESKPRYSAQDKNVDKASSILNGKIKMDKVYKLNTPLKNLQTNFELSSEVRNPVKEVDSSEPESKPRYAAKCKTSSTSSGKVKMGTVSNDKVTTANVARKATSDPAKFGEGLPRPVVQGASSSYSAKEGTSYESFAWKTKNLQKNLEWLRIYNEEVQEVTITYSESDDESIESIPVRPVAIIKRKKESLFPFEPEPEPALRSRYSTQDEELPRSVVQKTLPRYGAKGSIFYGRHNVLKNNNRHARRKDIKAKRDAAKFGIQLDPSFVANRVVRYIPLSEYDSEYAQIARLITNKQRFKVDGIEKIENPYLKKAYELKKEQKEMTLGHVEERLLFHGTPRANVDQICKFNFDWRLCKAHKFGKGVSFSSNANYASNYSDKTYDKVMIVAKVMIAKSGLGSQFVNLPDKGCDTTQKGASGIVIVKYDDNDFCPLYKINYHLDQNAQSHSSRRRTIRRTGHLSQSKKRHKTFRTRPLSHFEDECDDDPLYQDEWFYDDDPLYQDEWFYDDDPHYQDEWFYDDDPRYQDEWFYDD